MHRLHHVLALRRVELRGDLVDRGLGELECERIALGDLLARMKSFELAGEWTPRRAFHVHGSTRLPIPVSIAPVFIVTPRNPPITRMNSATSIAPNSVPEL